MTITISGEVGLAEFRASLSGRYGLELLARHGGRVLAQLPVGVGKTRWLDAITLTAVEDGDYDLVVVLCPTRRLIQERRPLQEPPPGIIVVNLRPRPSERCGPDRDALWRQYETSDLAALGRVEICGRRPHRHGCFWPDQFGDALEGARIVYATQAHLARAPDFLVMLRDRTGASRMLTLLDESDFIAAPAGSSIPVRDLERFQEALLATDPGAARSERDHQDWVEGCRQLLGASTEDLQTDPWRFPRVHSAWAAAIQRNGVNRYGLDFRFLGYTLKHLATSPVETRRRDASGTIEFANRPDLGDFIVFTGTADPVFAGHRLDVDLASPFKEHQFIHPGSRWFNLASPIGTRRYFVRHAPQILDFIAGLTARRVVEGKRVLLVAKRCFTSIVASGLAERFNELGADLQVIDRDWTEASLAEPRGVALIHYGMIGTNLFELFDSAFCVTGFYVDEHVVNQCLQDLTRSDLRLPIKIETVGSPRRRPAGVSDPDHRYYDIAQLAQPALEFKEHGMVVQAVGRVRPFTRPREIFTFQMGLLPGVVYDAEFRTLGEARRFFQIPSGRQRRHADRAARARALRRDGHTQAETAEILGVSIRTIRNYEHQ